MADQRVSVLAGVTKALVETGEDMTIIRKSTIPNPANKTLPGSVVEQSWTARGYVYPLNKWDVDARILVTTTMVIFDKLSFVPSGAVTQPGDIVIDSQGKKYKLLDQQNPRLLGEDMAFVHPTGAA